MLNFSDTSTLLGLLQRCEIFTGLGNGNITGDSTLKAHFTGLINDEYGSFVADAIEADGRFQYDDSNHTKQPAATFDLVASQSTYNFITDEQGNQILRLGYITIKDPEGNWINLTPIDISEFEKTGQAYDEFMETPSTPRYFDIQDGTGVRLFPAPNYNSTGGGKVYFQREPDYFTASDTTQKPGLPGFTHVGLAYGATAVWFLSKNDNRADRFLEKRKEVRNQLIEFYSRRNRYEQPQIIGVRRSAR